MDSNQQRHDNGQSVQDNQSVNNVVRLKDVWPTMTSDVQTRILRQIQKLYLDANKENYKKCDTDTCCDNIETYRMCDKCYNFETVDNWIKFLGTLNISL